MRLYIGRNQFIIGKSILLIIIIFLSTGILSSHAAQIEDAIPAYSMAYAVVKDIPDIWEGIKTSPSWQKVLAFDEIAEQAQNIQMEVILINQILGIDMKALLEIFGHRIALVQVYAPAEDRLPAIIFDTGDSKTASEIIQKVEQILVSNKDFQVNSHAGTYLSVPYNSFGYEEEELEIRYAFLGNLLVFALEQDTFEAIVDSYLGESPSLLQDPKFNKTSSKISAEGEAFAYLNLEVLWSTGIEEAELGALLHTSGLYSAKSVAWTIDILDPDGLQEMYIYTGDSQGLLTSLFSGGKELHSPHLIPASGADMFFAVSIGDPDVAWTNIKTFVGGVLGEAEYRSMENDIAEFERETTLSLEDDILSSLTGEVGFAVPFSEAGSPLNQAESPLDQSFIAFCGVKDRERCEMCIERILSVMEVQRNQAEYKGVTIYLLPSLGSPKIPIGYMFAGDMLVFGDSRKFMDLINEELPLVASEDFAQVNSQLSQNPSMLYYFNLAELKYVLLMESEDYAERLQALGSIGGTLSYDGEGLKFVSACTPDKSFLELLGGLAETSIMQVPF